MVSLTENVGGPVSCGLSNGGCQESHQNNIEKESRIWVDGCYDMVHFGHANSFRQARALGRHLTVGVHSDEEIREHKGTPPVFTETERYELVRAIKWVDDVVEAAPYVTTLETLDAHGCQYCAHGDDITTTIDGSDTYQEVKDEGRYWEYDRTRGVSTTDLIKRMIQANRLQEQDRDNNNNKMQSLNINSSPEKNKQRQAQKAGVTSYTGSSELILTTQKLKDFMGDNQPPSDRDRVVYVAGAFDVLNLGHIRFLQKLQELGTYVIVGVYDDPTVTLTHGPGFPLMGLHDRVLSLLACRYVQEIVIGAPLDVSKELLDHLRVNVVALGKNGTRYHPENPQEDLYAEAVKKDIFEVVDSGSTLTTFDLVQRVGKLESEYEERNRKKEEKEAAILRAQLKADERIC